MLGRCTIPSYNEYQPLSLDARSSAPAIWLKMAPAQKHLRTAEAPVHLKLSIIGVKVQIMPPDSEIPDQVSIAEEEEAGS